MARSQSFPGGRDRRSDSSPGTSTATAAQRRVERSQFLQPGASQRQSRYGTANPFANSTNVNPYVGIAWLGSGFPHPLPTVPPSVPPEPAYQALQYAASRPSYDLAGIAALLGPYFHIPFRSDFAVLAKIREAIPMISAAILRLKELTGFPEIEAEPGLKEEIDEFLRVLPVCRKQTGAPLWAQNQIDNMLSFGRAHTEVVLNATRDDIFGLVPVDPRTVGLRPTFGGYGTHEVQFQYGGGVPVTLLPELMLTSIYDIRGDDPNGTSAIAELPFVANILNTMLRSLQATWDRFGSPTYHVNWVPPTTWEDPTGAQSSAVLGSLKQGLQNALKERAEGKTNDYFTSGAVTVEIMGAQGETLEFSQSGRAIMEQICARFGLPPFMYGFSWSSTERMSTAQAKMVTEIIEALRSCIGPEIEKLVRLWLNITGRRGEFTLAWPKVSLQDLIDMARAALMDAQCEQTKLANWDRKVRLGINSMEEMAQEFREDLDNLKPAEVRSRLPKLVKELPEFFPAPLGGEAIGGAGTAPGQDPTRDPDRPERNAARPPGGMPRDEGVRMLLGNGNGKH